MVVLARLERDVGIDEVGMPGSPAQQPDGAGRRIIQRSDLHGRIGKEPCDARLTWTPAPGLRDDTGGNGHLQVVAQGAA